MSNAARVFKKCFSEKYLRSLYFDKIKETGAIGIDRVRPASFEKECAKEVSLISKKFLMVITNLLPIRKS